MTALNPKPAGFVKVDGEQLTLMAYRDVLAYATERRLAGEGNAKPFRIEQFGQRNVYMFQRGDNDWISFITLYDTDKVATVEDLSDGRLFDLMRAS